MTATLGATAKPTPAKPTPPRPPLAGAAHFIGEPLLRSFWKVRALGTWHVPTSGPVILAGNHANFVDGPMLFAFAPRPTQVLVKREMFAGALGPILRGIGHIPVQRGVADRRMITDSLDVLAAGGALGVFPEGTRGQADFSAVHNGLAYLALRSGAPIVPVACLGTGARGSSIGALPGLRSRIDVVYGKPFRAVENADRRATRKAVQAASDRIVERLTAHLREAERMTGRAG
ncbi:lysophospholipid acyltransferase family protein [Embleya sp. MST-111070]|uniref:lysophospholipid acyltransferase family protein n=1 Tax=Embleya sp. MST-111070 TaxID=3398231 RepID=UPI003F73E5BF